MLLRTIVRVSIDTEYCFDRIYRITVTTVHICKFLSKMSGEITYKSTLLEMLEGIVKKIYMLAV